MPRKWLLNPKEFWKKECLTRIRLVSLVSSAGKGVYVASATQLPKIVKRIKNSNGFHSTIWRQSFRSGFFSVKQYMERGARSGGGFAPIRRTWGLGAAFGWMGKPSGPMMAGSAMPASVSAENKSKFIIRICLYNSLEGSRVQALKARVLNWQFLRRPN